ncbi:MAG TPA: DUF4352 domain-containing protein [Bryobacteraceae bacterium]|nr:DUF4352 domain-containing protein [Bryobacteraceae bacterium]
MSRRAPLHLCLPMLAVALLLTGCANKQNSVRIDYPMGERVTLGPLTYNVIETAWRSQLGGDFKLRVPQQRYLMITISVTNGGGHEVSVPLLTLENQSGQTFLESDNGEGVDNWFGLLRTLNPAQTQQGRIVFDVPLTSYKLRVNDGGESGADRYAWIQIPLHIDADAPIDSPPATPGK